MPTNETPPKAKISTCCNAPIAPDSTPRNEFTIDVCSKCWKQVSKAKTVPELVRAPTKDEVERCLKYCYAKFFDISAFWRGDGTWATPIRTLESCILSQEAEIARLRDGLNYALFLIENTSGISLDVSPIKQALSPSSK